MICVVASVLVELEISLLRKTTPEILKQKPYLHISMVEGGSLQHTNNFVIKRSNNSDLRLC